jgi:hypothetical protein
MSGLDKVRSVSSEPVIAPKIQSEDLYAQTVTTRNLVVEGSAVFSNFEQSFIPTTQTAFRNVIINGDMRVGQRGIGNNAYTPGGTDFYVYDRWYVNASNNGGGFSLNPPTVDAPRGQSFVNSLKINRNFLGSAPSTSSSFYYVGQKIEGYYVSQLGYGSNNNLHTLSFWVKSSVAGVYCVSFRNRLLNRSYVAEYTINQTNTWEKKTITLPADSSGTWEKTNEIGLRVDFALGSGSNNNTVNPNTWIDGSKIATSNQVNWAAKLDNTFSITGVQLEPGGVATPFEHRPYDTELALCQRYYQNIVIPAGTTDFNWPIVRESATQAQATIFLPVTLRASPSPVGSNLGRIVCRDTAFSVAAAAVSGIALNTSGGPSLNAVTLRLVHGSIAGTFVYAEWDILNTTTNYALNSEL